MAAKDSIVSVLACAQHELQEVLFLTNEITPFMHQSTEAGSSPRERLIELEFCFVAKVEYFPFVRPRKAFFSVAVKWLMWFTVSVQVAFELLCAMTRLSSVSKRA